MAARTYLNDAGTWRQLRNIYVNDAGTWRTIRYVWINDAGTWRKVFQRAQTFTVTAGLSVLGAGNRTGYSTSAPAIGSISSSSLEDGRTVTRVMTTENTDTADVTLSLNISGFGADPGTTYLYSLEIEGIGSEQLASAASYSYAAGTATWGWANTVVPMSNTSVYTVNLAVT